VGLHQVLPGDDTVVLVGLLAVAAVADQDRRLGPCDSAALASAAEAGPLRDAHAPNLPAVPSVIAVMATPSGTAGRCR